MFTSPRYPQPDPSGKRRPRLCSPDVTGQSPLDLDPRFSLANERTYLAWIRTALALVAVGLIAAKAIEFEHDVLRWFVAVPPVIGGAALALEARLRWRAYERAIARATRCRPAAASASSARSWRPTRSSCSSPRCSTADRLRESSIPDDAAPAGRRLDGTMSQTLSERGKKGSGTASNGGADGGRRRVAGRRVEHLSMDEREAAGKAARAEVGRRVHGAWEPAADRSDPVDLLEAQGRTRVPELVPIRYGRMLVSPFTFFRGGAYLMASDLAGEPRTGLDVQLCGDAHLSNFGVYAAPDRRMVFSVNDFDETLPGPFEWDVKRLVASFEVAGRDRGFDAGQRREINLAVARAYREAMRSFAEMGTMDVWYTRLGVDDLARRWSGEATREQRKRFEKNMAKARAKDSMRARAMGLLFKLKERNAHSIFTAIGAELEKDGIALISALPWLEPLMPGPGFQMGPAPSAEQASDVQFGFRIAKEIARLDIGQTVVVKNGTVLAVEGLEGTDECLVRGGKLAGKDGGAVAVKVTKPSHDMRFDIPCIGAKTLEACRGAGISVLAFEAKRTLLLDEAESQQLTRKNKLSLVSAC